MLKKCFALLLGVSFLFFGCPNAMEMIQSIKDTSNPSTGGGGTPTGAFVISEKNAKIAQISLDASDLNNNTGTDKVYVWKSASNGAQADTLGRNHSIQLATVPGARANSAVIKGDTTPYATYGDDGTKFGQKVSKGGSYADIGSFRIPAINKVTLPNGKTRLIAAFDVRYRGAYNGGGDCHLDTNGETGVDITVLYSDDGGDTWTPAVNKKTGKKPAIDVENTNDGSAEAKGQTTKKHSNTNTLDICDPQLTVMPNGHIYIGMAAGSGNQPAYSNFRVFRSTDYGETWEESSKSTPNKDETNSFRNVWGLNYGNATSNNFKHVMTTPGHGIILTKDVPGSSSFKKGQAVMPIFHNCASGAYGYIYLATGSGVPEDWSTSNFSPDTCYNGNSHIEEGLVCQLDDGSLLLYSKLTGQNTTARFQRYTGNSWTNNLNQPTPFAAGKNCQVSILKVADGDGVTKHGVVAFSFSGNSAGDAANATQNAGRGNITVCFARDLSTKRNGTEHPLDDGEPYYIKIRTQGQSYFGYTDLVMIDDDTLGILFENYSSGANDIHGMRFARVNIRPIIDKLSQP